MRDHTGEAWDIFSGIEQRAIDEELARVGSDLEEFKRHRVHQKARRETPRERALEAHGFLVMASVLSRKEHILPEFRVHLADFAARRLTEDAQFLAYKKGRLAETGAQMEVIRVREGLLDPLDYWPLGEGPDDYKALVEESSRECERIADTVMATILRRYRMDDLASLFEQDRRSFELQSEIGRRIGVAKDETDSEWMDQHIREEYGDDALVLVHHRIAEIRHVEGTDR